VSVVVGKNVAATNVGACEASAVGSAVGSPPVGRDVGRTVGRGVGSRDGPTTVGATEGDELGRGVVGVVEGCAEIEGPGLGAWLGASDKFTVGSALGTTPCGPMVGFGPFLWCLFFFLSFFPFFCFFLSPLGGCCLPSFFAAFESFAAFVVAIVDNRSICSMWTWILW